MTLDESAREHVSLGAFAYASLREAIRTGRLRPGSRVREKVIADWLEISRTPVREALRRLEADGLLAFEPHRGMVIAELDEPATLELYRMREVLEGAAAAFAARTASEAEIARLHGFLDTEATLLDDAPALAELNREFHETIYRAAHNRYLLKLLSALRDSMTLLGPTTLAQPGRSAIAHGEHRAVVDAIGRGDADSADAAARAHIRHAYRARHRQNFSADQT